MDIISAFSTCYGGLLTVVVGTNGEHAGLRARYSLREGEERGTEGSDTLFVENLCCLDTGSSGGYFNAVSIPMASQFCLETVSRLGVFLLTEKYPQLGMPCRKHERAK